jgi:hypothetical protein
MNSGKLRRFVFLALALSAFKSWASDPIGIYAIVERVVFEPSESAPQRIQIWGAFALAHGVASYRDPQRGYLYYTMTPGKEDICRKEWSDLKAVAGTGQGIAFGSRYDLKTRVRKDTDKPETPDTYPISFGVTKVRSDYQQSIIDRIKTSLQSR